jgi:phosphoenolpyruvate carboxykinase (GTP)
MTGHTDESKLPRIYGVNWFRKDADGRFLWPGFGENSRVLKWVFDRCDGTAGALDTAIGRVPDAGDLDLEGLDVPLEDVAAAVRVDPKEWRAELPLIDQHYDEMGEKLPAALREELAALQQRLDA